jgi:hypothetical protein
MRGPPRAPNGEGSTILQEGKFYHQVEWQYITESASTHGPVAKAAPWGPLVIVPVLTVSTAWIEQKQLGRGRLTGN